MSLREIKVYTSVGDDYKGVHSFLVSPCAGRDEVKSFIMNAADSTLAMV